MADKNLLSQMLEHLVNEDQAKAEELFHDYVVQASREIYENLIESEIAEEEDKEDEDMDEAAQDDDADEDKVDEASEEDSDEDDLDENFEDVAFEGDDEPAIGGDPTDDLEGDLEGDEEGGDQSEEEIMQDLESIVDELQAKFAQLKGEEEAQGEFGDEEGGDETEEEGFDLATVREYVEKVPAGHGAEKKGAAEKSDNTKSTIDNMKNDMGGTTANILSSKEDAATYANQGALKGNGLEKGKVSDNPDAKGNVNVPGGNAGKTGFKSKEPGHGAEKKGSGESADNKQSLFRGRR